MWKDNTQGRCFTMFLFFYSVLGSWQKTFSLAQTQARRKRCGMAAVAAPKICREREWEKEEREERKRKEEKKERKERERRAREAKRKRCITPMGVKHPLGTVKYHKDTKRWGGVKKALKKQEERKKRQKRPEKTWWHRTDWDVRIRCRICILFQYHTISIIAGPLCQFYSSCQKRGYHLNGDPFFVSEYYRKVCIKSQSFHRFWGGTYPSDSPFSNKDDL